ncbi:hypothetical protein NPIL_476311 [Nephila pilipes]|uniref:Uncharacterized protein n=1 Tax=Nephila pilipes TaxID=299642 RepID=A0A8X6UA72_NEPPI|nr:hypothetical protein NPIL_476311 [Nephila pilipes]
MSSALTHKKSSIFPAWHPCKSLAKDSPSLLLVASQPYPSIQDSRILLPMVSNTRLPVLPSLQRAPQA